MLTVVAIVPPAGQTGATFMPERGSEGLNAGNDAESGRACRHLQQFA